jgi:hypothetical protein
MGRQFTINQRIKNTKNTKGANKMDAKKIYEGMVILTIFTIISGMAYAALPSAVSGVTATTVAQRLGPTNVVLDYDNTHVDTNLKAGDAGILTVVVKNVGTQAAENVNVYVPGSGDISVSKQWDIGRIEPLASKTVSTTITINKNSYIGLHTLSVRITYDGFNAEGERTNNQQTTWELPIRVVGNANFQISVNAADFYSDVTTKLAIKGTTQDGARSITATLIPGTSGTVACASIVGSSKVFLGDMGKGANFSLDYMVQPVDVGVCSFGLKLDYSDASGNPLSETLPVGIEVQRYDVDFKVTGVSYAGASPGSISNISVMINNVGSASAKDVSVTLDFSAPFTAIGSSERYVGAFASHDIKEIDFQASVDSTADIKAYDIPLTIEYFDLAGTKQTIRKSIGIQVDGRPEIKAILEKADLFTAGTKGIVSVTVVNKGFAQVKFLNLKMLSTEDYDVTTASEAYIGNLDSDSTDSQDFQIQIKNNASAGNIPLKFQITYKEQNSNVDIVDPVDLQVNVLSMQDYASKQPTGNAQSLVITAVGGLIGLVVVIVVLWFVYKLVTSFIGFLDSRLFKKKA